MTRRRMRASRRERARRVVNGHGPVRLTSALAEHVCMDGSLTSWVLMRCSDSRGDHRQFREGGSRVNQGWDLR